MTTDVWPARWARDLLQDGRYAFRGLRRTPGFTAVALIVLALGIGANSALFTVISAVLLRPLPYPDGDRLVRIWTAMAAQGYPQSGSSLPDYRIWRAGNHTFDEMGASHNTTYTLTGIQPAERVRATRMTASMWAVLRAQPLVGALFSHDAEQWGQHRVAVLAEGFWRRRFGADPHVVGRTIRLDDEPFVVAGVLPLSFQYPGAGTDLWTPEAYARGDAWDTRANHFIDVIGRLKTGVTLTQAQGDLHVIAAQIREHYPENAGIDVTIRDWHEAIVADARSTLLLLMGAVAMVLLIACTNVANLVLARSLARRHELTIRLAIGAGRGRIARQLLVENMLLASMGAALGLAVADALVEMLRALGPIGIPRLHEVRLDGSVIAFTAGIAVLTGLAFGIWPLRPIRHVDLTSELKESSRSTAGGTSRSRGRSLLLIGEVSLSLVLLIGAGLLIESLVRLQRVDPGFRPDHVVTARISLPAARYPGPGQVASFVQQVIDRIAAIPGVQAAGAGTAIPFGQTGWGKYFSIDGRPAPSSLAQVPGVEYRQITPGYFRALGAVLSHGRGFALTDAARQPAVAIVNETAARQFWPGEDPVGRRVSLDAPEPLVAQGIADAIAAGQLPKDFQHFPRLTVVGVLRDVRETGFDRDARPTVYVPFAQAIPPYEDASRSAFLVVRTLGDALSYQKAIEAAVHEIDDGLPVAGVRTMQAGVSESFARRRFAMLLLGTLAGIALVLVIAGLYGVMTYIVGQRQREFGVRLAMGATAWDLTVAVLRQGLGLTAAGILVGLALAGALSRFLSGQLFDVKPVEPVTYGLTATAMTIVAAVACGLPALRAARLDPASTLRHD